jgi:voltage-gated potassium channel
MEKRSKPEDRLVIRERKRILRQFEDWFETPMLILGFIWLVLLVVELIWGLNPFLESLGIVIWVAFILDFAVRFILAPSKIDYLKSSWLTALALLLPALRVFRIFRALRALRTVRAARGLRLVRVVTSINRGMRALGAAMARRGFGYIVALTFVVSLVGAAGMYAFENNPAGQGLQDYGTALWWTIMIMTTMGSEYWPRTAEGRVLCVILALYSFAVFGYVTATLASFFIGRDAENEKAEVAGARSIEALRTEIKALRAEMRVLMSRNDDVQ